MGHEIMALMDLGKLLHQTMLKFKQRIQEQTSEEILITHEHFGLLQTIKHMETDASQKEIAEKLCKDQSVVLRLIDSLEEKELVRRVVDKADRRKNYLLVTKTGERVLKEYTKIALDLMKDIEKGISEEDLEGFRKVLQHLHRNAENL